MISGLRTGQRSGPKIGRKLFPKNCRFVCQKSATQTRPGSPKIGDQNLIPSIFLSFLVGGQVLVASFGPPSLVAQNWRPKCDHRFPESEFFEQVLVPKNGSTAGTKSYTSHMVISCYTVCAGCARPCYSQSCATCIMMLKHTWTAEEQLVASVWAPLFGPKTVPPGNCFFQAGRELCRSSSRQVGQHYLLQCCAARRFASRDAVKATLPSFSSWIP